MPHTKKERKKVNMIYQSKQMEEQAALQTAARMCAAARTAPKAHGKDTIRTLVLTGDEKAALADKMDAVGLRDFGDSAGNWFGRDANNVRRAQAVVLVGAQRAYRGVRNCSFCGFTDCAACRAAGGDCALAQVDLGIAVSSAAAAAAAECVDCRIMFSIGKTAMELPYAEEPMLWLGIPLSISGKNIFFDRNIFHD